MANGVLTAIAFSQWWTPKFDPLYNQNPLADCKTFGADDSIQEMSPCAKFRANPSTGTSRQMGEM